MRLFHKESKMFLRRILKHKLVPEFSVLGSRFTHQATEISENSCQYPPIFDMSEEGQNRHYRQLWYDSIKDLPTVEQKLFELAIQQKKELKKYQLSTVPPTFNCINLQNYVTRTHIINDVPKLLGDMNVDVELNEIRETLCETLLNYYCNIWEQDKLKKFEHQLKEPNAGSKLANSLILQCYKKLALRNDYVLNSTIQQKPRILSFWWHGGFGKEEDAVDEKNLAFQFEDYGEFAIRSKQPLLPILDMKDDLCCTAEVPNFNFHPDVFRIKDDYAPKLASVPAYWPGDPYEYPFLLVLSPSRFQKLTSKLEFYDMSKIETGAAVISSFAWLNAVSTYHGFTPFHDLTYPLVTQAIVTNGQDWQFYVYQLNTIALHNDVDKKDRRNLCWSSGKLRLFDTVENGKVRGINEEVFRMLLKFLHNAPQAREGIDMKPYLGTDTRELDEITHTRYLLRKYYSRIPEHMAHLDEVPMWVKIYKLHPDAPPSPFVKLE